MIGGKIYEKPTTLRPVNSHFPIHAVKIGLLVLFLPFRFRNSERDESNSPSTAKINRSEFLFHC